MNCTVTVGSYLAYAYLLLILNKRMYIINKQLVVHFKRPV